MRAYFFGNMYLSSIQQGIQAHHTTSELFIKYREIDLYDYAESTGDNPPKQLADRAAQADTLYEWARNHKTSILLNGGYSATLRELVAIFGNRQNPYPWAFFNESDEALDGALTCVGIILPEKIYETAKALREGRVPTVGNEIHDPKCIIACTGEWSPEPGVTWELSKWEYELCHEINKYGMAS